MKNFNLNSNRDWRASRNHCRDSQLPAQLESLIELAEEHTAALTFMLKNLGFLLSENQ